eukprot:Pompholyxophrys_punicea_v1_NODE_110_length_3422_cov_27.309177.p7 type:complete len:121 gc:universal NODE_110_length_3422_cov_27.309177:2960-3322(+)
MFKTAKTRSLAVTVRKAFVPDGTTMDIFLQIKNERTELWTCKSPTTSPPAAAVAVAVAVAALCRDGSKTLSLLLSPIRSEAGDIKTIVLRCPEKFESCAADESLRTQCLMGGSITPSDER